MIGGVSRSEGEKKMHTQKSCGRLKELFDVIFVVNLDERPDRLSAVRGELKRVDLSFEDEMLERFSAIRPDDLEGFPSIGARGLFLSHLELLSEARRRKLKRFAIMEDDLVFTSLFLEREKEICEELSRKEWDLAWLGNTIQTKGDNREGVEFFLDYDQPIQTTTFVAFHERSYEKVEGFLREVQERPAGHLLGGPQHVDGAYNMFRDQHPEIKTLLAYPNLVEQKGFASDISPRPWYFRLPVIGALGRLAVRLKRIFSK